MKRLIKYSLGLIIISTFSIRCSHTAQHKSLMPPSESSLYRNLEEKDPNSVEIYLKKYSSDRSVKESFYWANFKLGQIWAETEPLKACEHFKVLAEEDKFPLKELAYLKEIETCPLDEKMIGHLFELEPDKTHRWLKSEIYELRYKVAKERKMLAETAAAANQLSRQSVIRNEKIAYTEESLRIARKLKDKDLITKYLKRLEHLSPSKKKRYERSDYFKIAKDYRRERNFPKAIFYYKKIISDKKRSFNEKKSAWKGIASTHKLNRDKEKHLKAMFSIASLADRNYRKDRTKADAIKAHHNAQISLARALWTQGKVSKARLVLETLGKWLKGSYPLDQVYWLIARMEEERTDYKDAVNFAKMSIAEATEKSIFGERSMWILAWNLKRTNNEKEAIDTFEKLIQTTDNSFDEKKYRFWLAHTYEAIGEKVKAYELYKKLGEDDPLGYYGLLSYRQRGENFPPVPVRNIKQVKTIKHLDIHRGVVSQIKWLISVNELKLAQNYLKQLKIKANSQQALHELYGLYIRAGHYAGIFRNLAKLPPEERVDLVEQNPNYLFPRPFMASINEASSEFGVKPALIYSIIRQESSFIPHARSFADAFGLMQLIPKQAKRLAAIHGVNYKKTEDLYKPYINLPLGTAFLRELWDRKKGQFVITVASYNASEKAVQGWINTRYFGDPITFIEDIPYDETKGYIKLVLRNFIWYQRLSVGDQSLGFPEWAFEGLEEFKK